jgi:methylenetetrahydrofolate dehydrogenase (NADP+) / methenyltetrahydrofolate cyclohydrolase
MTARIIDGKQVAAEVREGVARGVAKLKARGISPGLAVILVGENPASQVYVGAKEKAAQAAGMNSLVHRLPASTPQSELVETIEILSSDETVHGILLQLPLPPQLDADAAVNLINPAKDVDGLTPHSAGRLALGKPIFVPCTALGIAVLLKWTGTPVEGADVTVVGRSNLVGRPISTMLSLKYGPDQPEWLNRGNQVGGGGRLPANATVTLCHTGTRDLAKYTRRADVLIVAAGVPRGITAEMVKPGATVIDVGIGRDDKGKLVGDVDFDSVREVAGAITPVPGGVGPMTVAMLLANTLMAADQIED